MPTVLLTTEQEALAAALHANEQVKIQLSLQEINYSLEIAKSTKQLIQEYFPVTEKRTAEEQSRFLFTWKYFVFSLASNEKLSAYTIQLIGEFPGVLNEFFYEEGEAACNMLMLLCRHKIKLHNQLLEYMVEHPIFNILQVDSKRVRLSYYLRNMSLTEQQAEFISNHISAYSYIDMGKEAEPTFGPLPYYLDNQGQIISYVHYVVQSDPGKLLAYLNGCEQPMSILATNQSGQSYIDFIKAQYESGVQLSDELKEIYFQLLRHGVNQCLEKNNAFQLEKIFSIKEKVDGVEIPVFHADVIDEECNTLLHRVIQLSPLCFTNYYPHDGESVVYQFLIDYAGTVLDARNKEGNSLVMLCNKHLNAITGSSAVENNVRRHLQGIRQAIVKKQFIQVVTNEDIALLSQLANQDIDLLSRECTRWLGRESLITYLHQHERFKLLLALQRRAHSNPTRHYVFNYELHYFYLLKIFNSEPALMSNEYIKQLGIAHFYFLLLPLDSNEPVLYSQLLNSYRPILSADILFLIAEQLIKEQKKALIPQLLIFVKENWPTSFVSSKVFFRIYSELPNESKQSLFDLAKVLQEQHTLSAFLMAESSNEKIKQLAEMKSEFFSDKRENLTNSDEEYRECLLECFIFSCLNDYLQVESDDEQERAARIFFGKVESYLLGSGIDYWRYGPECDVAVLPFMYQVALVLFPGQNPTEVLYYQTLISCDRVDPDKDPTWFDIYSYEKTLPHDPRLVVRTDDGLIHVVTGIMRRALANIKMNYTAIDLIWVGYDWRCGVVGNLPIPREALARFCDVSPEFQALFEYTESLAAYEYLHAFSSLRAGLLKGSVNRERGGVGEEKVADKAADDAFAIFIKWWEKVPAEIQNQILYYHGGGRTVKQIFRNFDRANSSIEAERKASCDNGLDVKYCIDISGSHLESVISENHAKLIALSRKKASSIKTEAELEALATAAENQLKIVFAGYGMDSQKKINAESLAPSRSLSPGLFSGCLGAAKVVRGQCIENRSIDGELDFYNVCQANRPVGGNNVFK